MPDTSGPRPTVGDYALLSRASQLCVSLGITDAPRKPSPPRTSSSPRTPSAPLKPSDARSATTPRPRRSSLPRMSCVPPRSVAAARRTLPDATDEQARRKHVPGLYDVVMIALFRLAFGRAVGTGPMDNGWADSDDSYDALVRISRELYRTAPSAEAREERVAELFRAFPQQPQLLGDNRLSMEALAALTQFLFPFLVGTCHVEDWVRGAGSTEKSTADGERGSAERGGEGGGGEGGWRTKVVIERCRFLEASSCKGMCLGLCKEPSERYFGSIGLPVSLTPNFEDGSCEMVWGRTPTEDDLDGADLACFGKCELIGSSAAPADARSA